MKKFLASILGLAAVGGIALSAPQPAAAGDWSGVYVGGSIGYGWGDSDWTFLGSNTTTSPDFDGAIGGGHIGAQWQTGNIVFGVEAQLLGGNLSGSALCPNPTFNCDVSKISWLWLIGPRLGFTFGGSKWMAYVTGGYARATINTDTPQGGVVMFAGSNTHDGWTIGGGLEHAFNDHVIFGVEYNYVDLDGANHFFPLTNAVSRNVDPELHAVRARISFKFGRERAMPMK